VTDVDRAFAKTREQIVNAVTKSIGEAAEAIRDEARRNVPVDTGRLRDNIVAKVDEKQAKVGVFDRDSYYAMFVEFGTSDQQAQPFLGPAAELERSRLVKRIQKNVEESL
jgi:HK97 gp10 family phage protein